ncbi:hypothetical protein [Flavobacterium sp. ASW18X]|uniref:hypothetical protein n=1 Tax=Flavobacterium sp. ASW18X TaxID=2572595 RepID=UPI0010AE2CE9|nr:hypothetical protein [Flavobacterium sp. ASW18X]TKD65931.1 hypothetical protein FBT53_03435 [Flavobacterium sp. ASW18X]
MTCCDCKKDISFLEQQKSLEKYGVALCQRHSSLIDKIRRNNNTPLEAVQLYYALKEAGTNPMLEWWDGHKSIDIAISRVKLNIEVETEYQMLTHEQAIQDLEEAMHSFKNGFTTIRIPSVVIKYYLADTVRNIQGIMEGLKANIKVI